MGTAAFMISPEEITAILQEDGQCQASAGGVLVPTHCLYPSNESVVVEVAGTTSFTVSDRGGALDTILAHGVSVANPVRTLQPFAEKYGVNISNECKIFAGPVGATELVSAIVFVANAAKEAALITINKHRQSQRDRFKQELSMKLRERFGGRYKDDVHIVGASNKPYKFDGQITLFDDRRVLVSAATDEGNSINAVVVANLDVRAKQDSRTLQRIVYDDREEWRAESISVLAQGAPVIAFRSFPLQIEELSQAA